MTKEELKQEAEEYLKKKNYTSGHIGYFASGYCKQAYIDSAEPREKRIAELEATCNKWFEHLKNREEELLNELNNQNAKYNKQIEELEKENAELKEELTKKADTNHSLVEQMADLESENAELKKLKRECETSLCRAEYQYNYEQLTKAKELLERFLNVGDLWEIDGEKFIDLQNDVTQFLKDSEVEK